MWPWRGGRGPTQSRDYCPCMNFTLSAKIMSAAIVRLRAAAAAAKWTRGISSLRMVPPRPLPRSLTFTPLARQGIAISSAGLSYSDARDADSKPRLHSLVSELERIKKLVYEGSDKSSLSFTARRLSEELNTQTEKCTIFAERTEVSP